MPATARDDGELAGTSLAALAGVGLLIVYVAGELLLSAVLSSDVTTPSLVKALRLFSFGAVITMVLWLRRHRLSPRGRARVRCVAAPLFAAAALVYLAAAITPFVLLGADGGGAPLVAFVAIATPVVLIVLAYATQSVLAWREAGAGWGGFAVLGLLLGALGTLVLLRPNVHWDTPGGTHAAGLFLFSEANRPRGPSAGSLVVVRIYSSASYDRIARVVAVAGERNPCDVEGVPAGQIRVRPLAWSQPELSCGELAPARHVVGTVWMALGSR
jgi:hypothetical protein